MGLRLTKIYTKTGDKGLTMLANGERRPKSDGRILAYGDVDELNSQVGVLAVHVRLSQDANIQMLMRHFSKIQNELFDLGGELATPNIESSKQRVVNSCDIERLEAEMDSWNENLPPLKNFVLPGSGLLNAYSHVCRTVCRRAERRVVTLNDSEPIRAECIQYLNRLSDWFFVLSRYFSTLADEAENLWQQEKG